MATRSQDVELRIRATDFSKKTTDQVVDSLKALAAAQNENVEAAKRGTASAKELAAGYDRIEAAAKALVSQRNLVKTFDDQNIKLAETKTRLDSARAAQAAYVSTLDATIDRTKKEEAALAALAKSVGAAERAFTRIEDNIAKSGARLARFGIESNNTAAAQAKITAAITLANGALERQEGAITGLSAAQARRQARLEAEAVAQRRAADELVAARNRERAADQAWADAIDRARIAQEAQNAATRSAQQNLVAELNNRIALAQQIRTETDARLAQARAISAAAAAADAAARSAATVARGRAPVTGPVSLAGTIADIAAPSAAAARNVDGLEAAIRGLETRVSTISGPVRGYRDALREAADAQRGLAAIAGQVDAFNRQRAAVRDATIGYVNARGAVAALTAQLRAGTGGDDITQRLASSQATLRAAAAALGEVTTAARASQAALRAAGVDTANLVQAEQQLVAQATRGQAALNSLTEAFRRNGAAVEGSRGALVGWFSGGRTTLSYAQRIRGEILGLATAFIGLNAAVGLGKSTLDAYAATQAITSRLLIVNGGDARAAADDLKYLREQADRIGFSFINVAPAFTKFAIAAKSAGFAQQDTRFTFEQIAASAVRARLSTDELGGVLKAFEQILSKGKIQAEELRQQLGDRLPGAFQIAARAAGKTVEEYTKLIELGEIGSEQVVAIARELGKTYGAAEAGTSGLLEAQARFDNATNRFLTATGEGGFVKVYTEFLGKLTALLDSGKGDKLARELSAGFSGVINVIGLVADNLEILKSIVISLIGVSFVKWLISLPALFVAVKAEIILANAALLTFRNSLSAVGIVNALTAALGAAGLTGVAARLAPALGLVANALVAIGSAIPYVAAGIAAYYATTAVLRHFDDKARQAVQKTIDDSNRALADASRAREAANRAEGTKEEKALIERANKLRDIAVKAVKAQQIAVEAAKAKGIDLTGVTPGAFTNEPVSTEDPGDRPADVLKKLKEALAREDVKSEKAARAARIKSAKEELAERLSIIDEPFEERRKKLKEDVKDEDLYQKGIQAINASSLKAQAAERLKFNNEQSKIAETESARRVQISADVARKLKAISDDLDKRQAEGDPTKSFADRTKASQAAVSNAYNETYGVIEKLRKTDVRAANAAKLQLDALVALRVEDQKRLDAVAETVRLEKQFNNQLEIQRALKNAVATRAAAGALSPEEALAATNKITAETGQAIDDAGAKAINFANSVRDLLDPVAYVQLLANISRGLAQNNAAAVTSADNILAAQKRLNTEIERRDRAEQAIRQQRELGLISVDEESKRLNENNEKFKKGILDNAAALKVFLEAAKAAGLGNKEELDKVSAATDKVIEKVKNTQDEASTLQNIIVSGLGQAGTVAFDALGDAIGDVVAGQASLAEGFRNAGVAAGLFFAKLLKDIALAIIKQQILNALASFGGGISGAAVKAGGIVAGGRHNGGTIGRSPNTFSRTVSPQVFAGAQKFHNGGLPGLRPDEVALIGQKGEEMLSRDDPRNILNGGAAAGGAGGAGAGVRVVLLDDRSKVAEAMASSEGETVIMQTIKRNLPTIKQYVRS